MFFFLFLPHSLNQEERHSLRTWVNAPWSQFSTEFHKAVDFAPGELGGSFKDDLFKHTVAGLNVPLYLLNPLTQHLGKTWAQAVNTHRSTGSLFPLKSHWRLCLWDANTKKPAVQQNKTLHSISETRLNYTGSRSSLQHLKNSKYHSFWTEFVCPVLGQGL